MIQYRLLVRQQLPSTEVKWEQALKLDRKWEETVLPLTIRLKHLRSIKETIQQALKYRINWEKYTPYAGAGGIWLHVHINGKLKIA